MNIIVNILSFWIKIKVFFFFPLEFQHQIIFVIFFFQFDKSS